MNFSSTLLYKGHQRTTIRVTSKSPLVFTPQASSRLSRVHCSQDEGRQSFSESIQSLSAAHITCTGLARARQQLVGRDSKR